MNSASVRHGEQHTDSVGDGRLLTFGVRFAKQVWPGDTLIANAGVTAVRDSDQISIAEIDSTTVSGEGLTVLAGSASARIDP
jgi:acyl dehydratase